MLKFNPKQVIVVGSVAFDTVETPMGRVEKALGGSAVYFSAAARLFTQVRVIGVVGQDFPQKYLQLLRSLKIDTGSIEIQDGETFHWNGYYEGNLNQAVTRNTHLNVFATFKPSLSSQERHSKHLFLANIDPTLQLNVARQMKKPTWIACDTMNYWIRNAKEALLKVFKTVDICFINDAEIRECSGKDNLLKAAKWLKQKGPSIVVIKKGEHGVLCDTPNGTFSLPAFLIENVKDTTGAGDSFAGGFLGYLSQSRLHRRLPHIKKAAAYGSIVASFDVQSFSIDRLAKLNFKEISVRFNHFRKMISISV